MSTITRPARTLAMACGALSACATPAQAQSLPRPLTLTPATVTAEPSTPAVSPLGLEGLEQLIARAREDARRSRTPVVHLAPQRRLTLTAQGHAVIPAGAPLRVRRLIKAANRISHLPYVWGGGHGSWSASGYDCSGSVGYALHGAGVLDHAVTSGALTAYGKPGRGRWVTVYANGGHTYMVVAGLRFDTTAYKQSGSRWTRDLRGGSGYVVRHPAGL